MTRAGFPHSDTLGSKLGWQLPQAYRGLPRPSSAPGAKASTVRPRQLDHKDARVHCAILKQRPAPAAGCHATPRYRGSCAAARAWRPGSKQRLFPQDPTGCLSPAPAPTSRRSTLTQGEQYLVARSSPNLIGQRLRHRAPRRDTRSARAPGPLRARCSLERR
jgi:hypothetical protein